MSGASLHCPILVIELDLDMSKDPNTVIYVENLFQIKC